jgi:hypothetical protein
MEEYKLLREEILNMANIRHTTISILYTGVSAILVLGVSLERSLIFLLTFCVIIPTYMMVIDYSNCIKKIGAYLQVFHEDSEFNWESRLYELSKNTRKSIKGWAYSFLSPFYILSFIALGLFCLYYDFSILIEDVRIVELIIAVILFGLTLLYAIKHKHIDTIKDRYVLEWKKVKNKDV